MWSILSVSGEPGPPTSARTRMWAEVTVKPYFLRQTTGSRARNTTTRYSAIPYNTHTRQCYTRQYETKRSPRANELVKVLGIMADAVASNQPCGPCSSTTSAMGRGCGQVGRVLARKGPDTWTSQHGKHRRLAPEIFDSVHEDTPRWRSRDRMERPGGRNVTLDGAQLTVLTELVQGVGAWVPVGSGTMRAVIVEQLKEWCVEWEPSISRVKNVF